MKSQGHSGGTPELLSRHLLPGTPIEEEVALFAAQPPDKRKVVEERLQILDEFLTGESQTIADADAAAAAMGIARRRFYRLIAKLREVGPVRALSPGFRNVLRAAAKRDGLGEVVEARLKFFLNANPEAKLASIQRFITQESERLGFVRPEETAIRRRVYALRQSGEVRSTLDQFGASLVVDQCPFDLTVEGLGRRSYGIVTLLIDRNTRLIFGCGFEADLGFAWGLQEAIRNCRTRIGGFEGYGFPVASKIADLRWVVPPGFEFASDALKTDVLAETRRPQIEVSASGPRRHGDSILRLLGDRFGVYNFRRLALEDWRAPESPDSGVAPEMAHKIAHYCADAWNSKILKSLRPRADNRTASRDAFVSLADDIERLFSPVFNCIERHEQQRFAQERLRRQSLGLDPF